MTIALFSSTDGGDMLAEAVRTVIESLNDDPDRQITLDLMCFAFTDHSIAEALIALLRRRPNISLRVIADWSQSAAKSPTALRALQAAELPNAALRFKIDMPYATDGTSGRLIYSYAQAKGMLHHKTLFMRRAGVPALMLAGSFNWSARGRQAYENLILLDNRTEHTPVLQGFGHEFETLWLDESLTAAPARARQIFDALRTAAAQGVDLDDPHALAQVTGLPLAPARAGTPPPRRMVDGPCLVAFSGGHPLSAPETAGHSAANDRRAIELLRSGGVRRPAPLTLNTLTLEAIRSVPDGATLKVAMYALSNRVPEFQALIDAARRDVRVELLLDRRINAAGALRLQDMAAQTGLPITLRTSRRRMHQKYLCCPQTGMVLTGTANMTMEATLRHADHRILFRHNPELAAAFARDFDTIWDRVTPVAEVSQAA